LPLIIQLVSGAVGGNITDSLIKNASMRTLWNSVIGILGGRLGVSILDMLGIGDGDSSMDLGGIVGSIAGGGGVVLVAIGMIKKAMSK